MAQAKITVNAVPGSNVILPINTVVQLSNINVGGELSFTWTILDQPPGTADALSSSVLQNPTFTPKKEGTYLIKLIVNQGLPTEQEDRVVCGIRQLKTLERIPAAGETVEADSIDGWATASNSLLRRVDALLSDPGKIVGVNASGGVLTRGQVCRCTAASVIKTGLPGQETVPGFTLTSSATLGQIDELLVVVEGDPSGATTIASGGLMQVRYIGRYASATPGGTAAVGDTVYVNDSGALSLTQGTIRRRVGSAMSAGTTFDVWFNGVGGADIDLTPIDRAYVVYGNPGTLPNAFRVDGVTNASSVSGGNSFTIKTGDVGTITQVLRRFSGAGLDITQWQTEAGTVLASVSNGGAFSAVRLVIGAGSSTFASNVSVAGTLALTGFVDLSGTNNFTIGSGITTTWSNGFTVTGGTSLFSAGLNVNAGALTVNGTATTSFQVLMSGNAGLSVTAGSSIDAITGAGAGLKAGLKGTGGPTAPTNPQDSVGVWAQGGAGGGAGLFASGPRQAAIFTTSGASPSYPTIQVNGGNGAGQPAAIFSAGTGINSPAVQAFGSFPSSAGAGGSALYAQGGDASGSNRGGHAIETLVGAGAGSNNNAADILLSSSNPASTIGFKNSLVPSNVVKAWGLIQSSGGGTYTVVNGFNIASAAAGAANMIRITFPTSFGMSAANSYSVVVTPYLTTSSTSVLLYSANSQTTTTFDVGAVTCNTGVAVNLQTSAIYFSVMVLATQ